MHQHEEYEDICARAAICEASPAEIASLNRHLPTCEECSSFLEHCASMAVLLASSTEPAPQHLTSENVSDVPRMTPLIMSEANQRMAWWSRSRKHVYAGAAVLLFATIVAGVAIVTDHWHSASSSPATPFSPEASQDTALLKSQLNTLTSELAEARSAAATLQQQMSQLKSGEQQQQQSSEVLLRAATQATESAQHDLAQKEAEVAALQASVAGLQKSVNEAQVKASADASELASLRQAQTGQLADFLQQQADLQKLKNEAAEERKLLDAGPQVGSLITARNLHIIDVHDNEGSTKTRAFGRIFYVEGKSLAFYAYDLADPANPTKVAFHVWGEQLGGQQKAKNLGVLQVESKADGRWALTFEDPKVLAKIDTVYVTAESARRNGDEPKGKRILYAFINGSPNHP